MIKRDGVLAIPGTEPEPMLWLESYADYTEVPDQTMTRNEYDEWHAHQCVQDLHS